MTKRQKYILKFGALKEGAARWREAFGAAV